MWTLFLVDRENGLTLKHRNPMLLTVFKCQNASLDYQDSQEVHRKADGAVHYDQVIDECKKKQSDKTECWSDEMKKRLRQCSALVDWKWVSVLAKGGGQNKRFQYCLNPNYPHQFLYLRAIQGHSGSTINPALQDNVLLPEGFTECIYHIGNGKELRSIANHGLIPEGVSPRTGRQAVLLTVVNPVDSQAGLGETQCDSSQARIAPYKNTWKRSQNTVFWCNLKLAQQRGLQFYPTRSNAVILHNTHCLQSSFEKAICTKTKDQLYRRHSVILRPRLVLKAYVAMWFTRSTCTRSKIILGIATRCGELRWNSKQR